MFEVLHTFGAIGVCHPKDRFRGPRRADAIPTTHIMENIKMNYRYPFGNANEQMKRSVWNKGKVIAGLDATMWRHDTCGKLMCYASHGDRTSVHGWEIDHIKPSALGGSDDLSNLQPLQWKNNASKGDTYPWSCSMAA